MEDARFINAHENVFAFGSHLASTEVLQMSSLIIVTSSVADVGLQLQHFVTGTMEVKTSLGCSNNCYFQTIVGKGDYSGVEVFSKHKIAEDYRLQRKVR